MYANRDIKAYKKKEAHKTASHAFRADPENENVDYTRSINNVVVLGADNYEDYKKDLANAIALTDKSRKGKKVRIDANLVINQVFNASPEYFFDFKKCGMTLEQWQNLESKNPADLKKIREVWKTLDNKKLEQYQAVIVEHLQACHKHTISLVLHLDEKTPHWHASSVPIVKNQRGELALSAKQYYKKSTLSAWNKDFKARINKLNLAFSKPAPDVQLSAEQFSVSEQLSKPAPPQSRRRPAYEPVKKFGVFYSEEEVQKLKKSYESREKNLKEIIANYYKFYDDNAEKIRQFNNLQAKHSVALKELQQLREYKNYTRNYRKLVSNEKKMREQIELQKQQIEQLEQELQAVKPVAQMRDLEQVEKSIEQLRNSSTISRSNKRGYTP